MSTGVVNVFRNSWNTCAIYIRGVSRNLSRGGTSQHFPQSLVKKILFSIVLHVHWKFTLFQVAEHIYHIVDNLIKPVAHESFSHNALGSYVFCPRKLRQTSWKLRISDLGQLSNMLQIWLLKRGQNSENLSTHQF